MFIKGVLCISLPHSVCFCVSLVQVHLASNSLASTQKFSSRTKFSNNRHARSKSRQNTDGIENRILHAPKSKDLEQNRKKKIPKQKIKIDSPYKSKILKNKHEAKPSLGMY